MHDFTATMGLFPDMQNGELRMRWECWERFPCHRGLTIATGITARASRTRHDACRDRQLAVSFEVGGGENPPGIIKFSAQPAMLRIWWEVHDL